MFVSAAFSTLKFPVSGDEHAFYPSGTGGIPFIWDIYSLLSGGQKRVRASFLHQLFLK